MCRADLPEDIVYQVTKIMYEDAAEHIAATFTLFALMGDNEDGLVSAEVIPMHPGAAKFWRERGVDLAAKGITVK